MVAVPDKSEILDNIVNLTAKEIFVLRGFPISQNIESKLKPLELSIGKHDLRQIEDSLVNKDIVTSEAVERNRIARGDQSYFSLAHYSFPPPSINYITNEAFNVMEKNSDKIIKALNKTIDKYNKQTRS